MKSIERLQNIVKNPVLLAADNFTPLTRTPWAGREIANRYKDQIVLGASGCRIGESWEFSCDPDFPSMLNDAPITLPELITRLPDEVLSPELAKASGSTSEILVKLLNAAEPLSLQVHPEDDDPALKENESGKPESWLILHAEPGAGIYLGFSKTISREDLEGLLEKDDRCKEYLQFVEVQPGDYFELAAGVPHAIGAGVTLIEPQRILFGKSGKTYRLWDWGRRYDKNGNLDMENGMPRQLHVKESLRLIDPMQQVGEKFLKTIRRIGKTQTLPKGGLITIYPDNGYYQLIRIELACNEAIKVAIKNGYGAIIPLAGTVSGQGVGRAKIALGKGQPALFPSSALPIDLTAITNSDVILVIPATAEFSYTH